MPVTFANKEVDIEDVSYVPTCEKDKESWDGYDAEYDGAPVAIQVVARRLQEEKVLAFAEIIDECLKMVEASKLAN